MEKREKFEPRRYKIGRQGSRLRDIQEDVELVEQILLAGSIRGRSL